MFKNFSREFKKPISTAELARRRAATVDAMKARGIDAVFTQNHSFIFDGYIRYFFDMPTGQYSTSFILNDEGFFTVIQSGGRNLNAPVPDWARDRAIERMAVEAYCLAFNFNDNAPATVAVDEMKKRGYKKIGLVGFAFISMSTGEYLKANLPGVEFVDFTDDLNKIMAVKSAEEILLCEATVKLHDNIAEAVPHLVRPGRFEADIRADIVHVAWELGADYTDHLNVTSFAPGQLGDRQGPKTNRVIQEGDIVQALIEVSAAGGMFGEVCRQWCLAEPTQAHEDIWKISVECQHHIAKHMKPGKTGADMNDVYNTFMTALGFSENMRFFGHGQGYNLMERPAFCADETMVLEENMFVAIHPETANHEKTYHGFACDNFLITKNEAVLMSKTPQRPIYIDR